MIAKSGIWQLLNSLLACDLPVPTVRPFRLSNEALEAPNSPSDLYLASSPEEVEQACPFMTGDVFEGISIPGLPVESEGLGIVLTHPCSMRADGVRLIPRLHVASVATSQQIPLRKWSDGHFKVMPLPSPPSDAKAPCSRSIGIQSSIQWQTGDACRSGQ